MSGTSSKHLGNGIVVRRIRLSLLLGAGLTSVFGLMLSFLPFSVGKVLFWPAALFVRVYDEQLGAPFYYQVGLA
ncbi:MAG TPA: hypothetical protein VJ464_04700, partial [Blastocatellia bacterium]|nr:hypothetical protein [Blastocatellia bacterium]